MNLSIYICGPMSGLPDLNFPAFYAAEDQLKRAGYAVLNPADRAGRVKNQPWEWYLRRGILDVCRADGIALLPGWENSRGAQLEMHVANQLAMPSTTVDGWVALATQRALE